MVKGEDGRRLGHVLRPMGEHSLLHHEIEVTELTDYTTHQIFLLKTA